MRYKILPVLSFVLFLCIQNVWAAESEPNNTRATANTLALNGSNSGAIGVAGDEDWWSVTTNADGKLNVTITISNSIYMWCQILDNNGTTILSSGYTLGSTVVAADGLAAGTYYLKLFPYYGGQLPAYTVSNTLTVPTQANDAEPNNTRALAKVLNLNSSKTGHINYYYNNVKDTFDWYKITPTADGRIRLTMTSANGQNVWAYLYDNDGTTVLASGYTSGSAVVVDKDGLAAGTYYIRVNTYYNSEWAPYTLADSVFVAAPANDTEPNNAKALALTLPLNTSVTGHVNYYYNKAKDSADWYKVTTNADGRLRLTMKSGNGQNVWAYLYDTDGNTVLASGYTAGSDFVVNKDGLAAGTYYVRVNTYYTSEWAPYTLTDSLFAPTQANDTEPNNNKTVALNLTLNSTVTGHVNYYSNLLKDSSDWYKLTIPQDGMINLTINSNNGQNVWVYLFDKDGSTQLNAVYSSSSASIKTDGLGAGTYYVRVNTYYTSEWAPYTLTNAFTAYGFANDSEPNDYFSQAKTIPSNGTVTGHVNFYYDGVKNAEDRWKINYTGNAGTMTLNFNQEAHKSDGSIKCTWLQVYKDTTLAPIYNSYFCGTPNAINLTGLTKGYYYLKVFTYYTNDFTAYSISPVFTQTKATVTLVATSISTTCDSTNSITIKCGGSKAPYSAQLYRYNQPYGTAKTITNTQNYVFSNLPKGNYTVRVYGDGATGTAYGTFPAVELMPKPVNARTTAIQTAQARLNWDALSCANYFTIQYRQESAATWTTVKTNGNTTFYILRNLTPSTRYYWRVAATDSANNVTGLSAYTDSVAFTTTAAAFVAAGQSTAIQKGNELAIAQVQVSVYPNPASSFIKIRVDHGVGLQITASLKDINGRIVWSGNAKDPAALATQSIDVSKLTGGIYILHLADINGKSIAQTKVVITR